MSFKWFLSITGYRVLNEGHQISPSCFMFVWFPPTTPLFNPSCKALKTCWKQLPSALVSQAYYNKLSLYITLSVLLLLTISKMTFKKVLLSTFVFGIGAGVAFAGVETFLNMREDIKRNTNPKDYHPTIPAPKGFTIEERCSGQLQLLEKVSTSPRKARGFQ